MAAAAFKLIIGAAAAVTACTSIAMDAPSFEGSRWHVTAVNGRATPAGRDYHIEFNNGQVGGRLGCNNFGGPVRMSGETVIAGQIVATEMACGQPADLFENSGFAIFRQPMRWQWTAGLNMTLSNSAGSIVLVRMP